MFPKKLISDNNISTTHTCISQEAQEHSFGDYDNKPE